MKTDRQIAKNTRDRMKRQNDYIKNNYDRVSVVMKKGYRNIILENYESINGFIVECIEDRLKKDGFID